MKRTVAVRAAFDHVVLEVEDPVRSARFYEQVFGFVPVRLREFRDGQVLFPSSRVAAGTVIDFFPRKMWRGRRPQNPNHFCISLDAAGVRALEKRMARAAVAITRRDDHNFGARGLGVALYFTDPDGITVEARFYPTR